MKKIIAIVSFVVTTASIAFATDNIHLISVNGIAEVSIDPNMVVLQVESWGKAASAKSAQEIQAQQYVKIKSIIEKFKIKKEDFKTENYSVNPDYVYDQKSLRNKIMGYRSSHQISVTFRKTEEAGQLIDALTSAAKSDATGGVSVQSISWDSDKKSVVESSAINEAVTNARSKAEELAKAAGVKIKAVHRISHNTTSAAPQAAGQMYSMKAMSDGAEATQLSSGKIKVRVDVQMEFEI